MSDVMTPPSGEQEVRAEMSSAQINDLKDSDFAYIEPGGEKDADGKTTPRSLRHFPIHDEAHVRNALSRAPQSPFGDKAMPKIKAAAKKFGIDTDDSSSKRSVVSHLPRRKERHRAIPLTPEVRFFAADGLEVREADQTGDTITLTGAPIVYNADYSVRDVIGEFNERMAPGVASSVLGNCDCRFLFNHDGLPLARTLSGTLSLDDTDRALTFAAQLDLRQSLSRDLVIAIERGDVSQMSCGFIVAEDTWDERMEDRTIIRFADLLDVSAVTYPASPTTSIDVAKRMALSVPIESRARLRKMTVDLRAGKVLSSTNKDKLVSAVTNLHSVLVGAGVDPASLIDSQDGSEGDSGAGGDESGSPETLDDGTVNRTAPATRDERRAMSLAFDDQRGIVYQALIDYLSGDDPDQGADLWICDLGADWVVFEDWDSTGPSLNRIAYSIDGTTVTFSGDPTPVNQVTTYEPVTEPDGDTAPEERTAPLDKSLHAKKLRLELEARKRRRVSA